MGKYKSGIVRFFKLRSLYTHCIILLILSTTICLSAAEKEIDVTFEIVNYMVEGNSILTEEEIELVLTPYTGPDKNADIVNSAKDALEKFYHYQGYPAVIVNIPLQTLENSIVKFQVIESKIGKVRASGNKYFTMKRLMRSLPSIHPGKILYLPQLEKELNRLNRNRHITVAPLLSPGRKLGTIDVDLKVKDTLPLHGSVELNNYSTHTTTALKNSYKLSYDNFWQRDHSLSLQFQTSPEDLDEVKVLVGSYLLNSFIDEDHLVALYAVWSDSDITFVDDLRVVSKGRIYGLRYIIPLPGIKSYYHSLTLGMDYKDFDEIIDLNPGNKNDNDNESSPDETETPVDDELPVPESSEEEDEPAGIDYLPFFINYGSSFSDAISKYQLSIGLSSAFRGVLSETKEFDLKRLKARPSYLAFTASLSREQDIFEAASFFCKLNVQLANIPLISNEQFFAGGANSVRGYKENEATGDTGVSGMYEIRLPDLGQFLPDSASWAKQISIKPYIFYDVAALNVHNPLPGQKSAFTLQGTGMGIRGRISEYFSCQFDLGYPLVRTDGTDSGDLQLYFKIRGQF